MSSSGAAAIGEQRGQQDCQGLRERAERISDGD
jgi:hypothetical protein